MKKQLSRREFLKTAGVTGISLGVLAAAGCAPQIQTVEVTKNVESTVEVKETVPVQQTVIITQTPAATTAPVNINFIHGWIAAIAGPVITPMINQYMADHPGVIISQTGLSTSVLSTVIMSAVAAGTPPDIAWGYTSQWVKDNVVVALDDYLTKLNYDVDQIYPYVWDMFSVNGKKYGMPIEVDSVAWWYLNDMMKADGLTPPTADWTWNDLLDYGTKMTKKTGNRVDQWGMLLSMSEFYYYINLLIEEGGSFLSDDLTKPAFNSDAGLKAMNFALSLQKAGVMPPPGFTVDVNSAFQSKLIGLQWDGPWRFGNYVNEMNLDTGVVAHPKCPDTGSNVSYVIGEGLGVFKTTDARQEGSMEFLTWFMNKDNNAAWGVQTGYLPVRKDSATTKAYTDFEAGKGSCMKTFLSIFDTGVVLKGNTTLPKYDDATAIFNEQCWEPVLLGKLTPEAGLAAAEKAILADPTILQS